MCQVGDIILISEFKDLNGEEVGLHPFIIVDDQTDKIKSLELEFDLLGSMLGSFHDKSHKQEVLKKEENIQVARKDGVAKDGYIKSDCLHYFRRKEIEHHVIGRIREDLFNLLLDHLEKYEEDGTLSYNLSNL